MEISSGAPHTHRPPTRSGHVAVCVDRYMLVLGGYNNEMFGQSAYCPIEEVWVYHMDLHRWFNKKTEGDIPLPVSGARAEVVDHCLYLLGGHTHLGNTNTTYCLNLRTWVWSLIPVIDDSQLFSPRDKCVSWTFGMSVYLFGGFGPPIDDYMPSKGVYTPDRSIMNERGWNNQLFIFDTELKKWNSPHTHGTPPSPRAAHAAALLGDKVFIFGGRYKEQRMNDLHCLHLPSMTWSGSLNVEGRVPRGRSWHSLSPASDSTLFLHGGFSQDEFPICDGWLLDIDHLQWTQLQTVPLRPQPQLNASQSKYEAKPRLWHTACSSDKYEIFIFGGCLNNILDETDPSQHSSDLLYLELNARSLLQLCLDKVECHIDSSLWVDLPQSLLEILKARYECRKRMSQEEEDLNTDSTARTCVLS